jgi:Uma2 family endonuclease
MAKLKTKISIENYLEGENSSEMRHEYIYGEVFAMAGASTTHNRIITNIGYKVDNHLENSRCETYTENVKLKTDARTFYYPDAMVSCD